MLIALIGVAIVVCAILTTVSAARDDARSVSAHGRLR